MGVELAGTACSAAVAATGCSSSALKRKDLILPCCDLGGGAAALTSSFVATVRPLKARSFYAHSRRRGRHQVLRRAFTAGLDGFPDDDDEEFVRKLEELATRLQGEQDRVFPPNPAKNSRSNAADAASSPPPTPPSSSSSAPMPPWLPIRPEPPDWASQIVPASVEKNANSVDLPLSLRLIKRKKRWDDGVREAGEAARCSVMRAFSSMVFMIRELQSTALQMREALFYEDLQGILARVQREMNSSFVWLFQQIFSCTPALMVSVMLLLANFTVYSMDNGLAFAAHANSPPSTTTVIATVVEEQPQFDTVLDKFSLNSKPLSSASGRTASIWGNGGGGGGKVKPVAGATDDGWWGEKSSNSVNSGSVGLVDGLSRQVMNEEDEMKLWDGILDEVYRMKASSRDEALMEPETLRQLVAPVTVELEVDDGSDYLRTEIMYHQALSHEPNNVLLLSNFAQFLYLVLHDHDRAEHYFKRAISVQPADAEALSRYANFLWLAKKDLTAAEETYLEAIAADPGNTVYAGNYAHFLWSTGGEETCYPLDGPEVEAEADML